MLPFEFKPKDGVILFISIPFTSIEVEITSEKEVDPSQESIGEEEDFRMVVKRVASALGVEADSLCQQAAKSSQEPWTQATPQSKWKQIPNVLWDSETVIKDTKSTWHKSCRESLKRKEEVLQLAEEMKTQGSSNQNDRVAMIRGLNRIKKVRSRGRGVEPVVGKFHKKGKSNKRGSHGLSRSREKQSEHFGYQNMANDSKQRDQDGESGKRLRRTINRHHREFGWSGEKDNPRAWIDKT